MVSGIIESFHDILTEQVKSRDNETSLEFIRPFFSKPWSLKFDHELL